MSSGQKSCNFLISYIDLLFIFGQCGERSRSLNPNKTIAMALCHISLELSERARCMMGMWICVRSKDAQKQLARTSLMGNLHSRVDFIVKPRPCLHNYSHPIISFYFSKSHRFLSILHNIFVLLPPSQFSQCFRLGVVPLWLSPSCMTRKKTARKKNGLAKATTLKCIP